MGIEVTFMRKESRESKGSLLMTLAVIVLILIVEGAECILTRGPPDTITAVTGSTVTLPCYTNLSLPIYWQFDPVEGEIEWLDIYRGNPGEIVDCCRPKYAVQVDSTENQYNLTIVNIQPQDAGTYRCSDDSGLSLWLREEGHVFSTEVFIEAAPVTLESSVASTSVAGIVLSAILGILLGVLVGVAMITFLILQKVGHSITYGQVIKLYKGEVQLMFERNESDEIELEELLIPNSMSQTDYVNLMSDVECLVKSTVNSIRSQKIDANSHHELDILKTHIDRLLQQSSKADTILESPNMKMNSLQKELVILGEKLIEIKENSKIDGSVLQNEEVSENLSITEERKIELSPQSNERNANSQVLNLSEKLEELCSLMLRDTCRKQELSSNTAESISLARKLESVTSELRLKEKELNDAFNTIKQRDEELDRVNENQINYLINRKLKMMIDITNIGISAEDREKKFIEYQKLLELNDEELNAIKESIQTREDELKKYQDKPNKTEEDKLKYEESLKKTTEGKQMVQEKIKRNIVKRDEVEKRLSVSTSLEEKEILEYELLKCDTESEDLNQQYQGYIVKQYTKSTSKKMLQLRYSITGVTVVDDQMFVLQEGQSQVSVYNTSTLDAESYITIPGMKNPGGLAGCPKNKALFISDMTLGCIHKVDIFDNNVDSWKVLYPKPRGLSLTLELNLLITIWDQPSKMLEYTSEGKLIRDIEFDKSIKHAWQTVQLSTDLFIICHEWFSPTLYRLCAVNSQGEIIKDFKSELFRCEGHDSITCSLAINDRRDLVFVADYCNNKVLILMYKSMPNLTLLGQVQTNNQLLDPRCLFYYSNRLIIGDKNGQLLIISASDQ